MPSQSDEGAKPRQASIGDLIYIGVASILAVAAFVIFRQKISILSADATVYWLGALWGFACALVYVYRRWHFARKELAALAEKITRYEARDIQRAQ